MGKNWAIAIGINQYDNLQPLKYAQLDAEVMAAWFKQEANFDQVFLFTENSPPILSANPLIPTQPTYARFQRFLDVQFERRLLKPEDNLWFFFAGHGRRYADQDYLMFLDSNPQAVDRTAISVDYVTQRLRRSGADNVVLFIDACRDEDSRSGLGIGQQEFKGVITFYSCAANQKSWEIDELQHGSFTYTLLEGLRIQGEANCATVERLYEYLYYHVPRLNAHYHKSKQNPYLKAEPPYKMDYILLEKVASPEDTEQLKFQASKAENKGDFELAQKLWMRVLALPGIDNDALEAIKRITQKQEQSSNTGSNTATQKEAQRLQQQREAEQLQKREAQKRQRQQQLEKWRQLFSTITTQTPINRRRFLQWAGLGGGGLVITLVGREFFNSSTKPITLSKFKFEVVTVNSQGKITNRRPNQAELFKEDLGNGVALEMVSIPRGSFKMGSPPGKGYSSEKPQHNVTLSAFFMGKFEITQEQYQQVMSKNPSHFKGNKRPVERVNWNNAMEFCKKLSYLTGRTYRLPSEAEWEYACRAGTTTPFHFGETITSKLANYDASRTYASEQKGEYRKETTPVGQFPPNAFGLYDMHGNVWEWCQDRYLVDYNRTPFDWFSGLSGRVLRGGSWDLYPGGCRSANRFNNNLNSGPYSVGLRVVCVVALRTLK